MNSETAPAAKGGWKVLGLWVTLAFVVLAGAWFSLIKIANANAPEPVPLQSER